MITIASDSMVAVSWVNDKVGFGNLNNVDIIYDIRSYLQSMKGMRVIYNLRSTNSFADNLAKLGSSSGEDKLEWEF